MILSNSNSEIFIPEGISQEKAISQTTELCIAAHQDDIEIMAYGPISSCYGSPNKHFTGVVVTDGGGSPRSGVYANYTDEEMKATRVVEQKNAALIGKYSAQIFLSHKSSDVKDPKNNSVKEDIKTIIANCNPNILYTHNLADKHDTHVALAIHVIKALREVKNPPKKVISLEVWRSLDWLCDEDKVVQDTSLHSNLASSLVGVFDSQVSGGKRYDLAAIGRRLANATFFASHSVDDYESSSFGLDITDLVYSDTNPSDFISMYIDKFKNEVKNRVEMFL